MLVYTIKINNINFLYCGKCGKVQSYVVTLNRAQCRNRPNIFMNYVIFEFHDSRSKRLRVIVFIDSHIEDTDSHVYFIV